jgi:Fe-S cluster assembly iron-binding protein IscA
MLTLTNNASLAIEGILSASTIPDGAGVRIAPPPGEDAEAADQLQVTIAGAPADTDQVIDDAGARVFVDETVAPLLDDKLLDADLVEDQVHFSLGMQHAAGDFGPSPDGFGRSRDGLGDV